MKNRCGFYSKLEYCERVVEKLWGGGGGGKLEIWGGGEASPPVDETLAIVYF